MTTIAALGVLPSGHSLPAGAANGNAGARPAVLRRRAGPGNLVSVGLKDLRRRLTVSVEQLDQARLQDRYQGLDVTAIGEAEARVPIRVGGEVKSLEVVPRAGSPSLEVTIADGTGRAVAVFTGCKRKGGLDPGRSMLIEGVARLEHGRLVLMNPAYTLLGS